MRTRDVLRSRTIALCVLGALPFCPLAGKLVPSSIPLRADFFTTFVDEQNTNAYFNDPNICPFYGQAIEYSNILPDTLAGPTSAWGYVPWAPKSGLQSGTYDNSTTLRVEFSTNDKVFSLDSRGSVPLRKLTLDFTHPYGTISDVTFAGSSVATPVLFQVSGLDPLTTMSVCSSTACPEARQIATKLWFDDPSAADTQWRVDWAAIRVLRVSSNKWYFIAGQCGGSQLAGLSKLVGTRTKPRETLNGHFLMPMFFAAERK